MPLWAQWYNRHFYYNLDNVCNAVQKPLRGKAPIRTKINDRVILTLHLALVKRNNTIYGYFLFVMHKVLCHHIRSNTICLRR